MAAPATEVGRNTDSKRPIRVFISYSRSEAMMVEYLGERLRERGLRTWIDFQDLEPGTPWQGQLDDAVDRADVVVLVVSRRAVVSEHVGAEWKRALAQGKQVVLYIAEAAPIPEPLRGFAWIDGRTRSRRSVDQLADVVDAHRVGTVRHEPSPPPEHGFRAPARVWFAFVASILTALAACFAFWTLILPVVLVPLPLQVLRHSIVGRGSRRHAPDPHGTEPRTSLQRVAARARLGWQGFTRRTFNYTDVRNALFALPVATLFSSITFDPNSEAVVPLTVSSVTMLAAPATFLAIRGGAFRRWAQPAAARPTRRRPTSLIAREPRRVVYRIDASPADRDYANIVERVLAEHGHVVGDEAEVVIRVVSQYHDVADVGLLERTIPIVVADADDRLPEQLSRTQWIDLRRGADRRMLDSLARYLDEPAALFQDIGNPPPHEQRVLPRGVQALFITLWATVSSVIGVHALIIGGAINNAGADVGIGPALAVSATIGSATVAAMLWMTRSLRTRRPGRLPVWLVWLAAIGNLITIAPILWVIDADDDGPLTIAVGVGVIVLALMSILLVAYRYLGAGEISRWLPTKDDAKLSASLARAAPAPAVADIAPAPAPGGPAAPVDEEARPEPASLPWPTGGDRAADVVRSPPRAIRRQPGEQHQQPSSPDV
jgi:hypothetical protein